ncbi:MAG: P-loop NTPase [Bacilli bacterium]|nr:P-loop NTPase [Bacilli bacterium]MBN2877714.1 P-loop NTPase [Bacilli bacterium]
MSKISDIKEKIKSIKDPVSNLSFQESSAIKHVGIDEESNTVMFVVEVEKKNPDVMKELTREIAKVVKIDMGYKGIKIDFVEKKVEKSGPKTILIASGKGGVGKSTVTANLAYAMMRLGKRIAIIDADVYGANMPKILGGTGHQLLGNKDGKIYPFEKDGIQMVSTEYLVEKNRALLLRGPMLNKVLKLFFEDTLWTGEIDYFLVDLPPGTGDIMLDMRTFIDDAKMVLVTTPQANASHIAIKAGYAAKDLGHEILGVIENMSYYEIQGEKHYIFGQGGGKEVADELMVELLEQLPIVPSNTSIYSESDIAGIHYLNLAHQIMKLVK